jgi:hypothetical protein
MGRYVITNSNTVGTKKMLAKYGSISIETEKLVGTLQVVGYRKYSHYEEVDVEFTGKIQARVKWGKLEWFDSSILTDKNRNVSKIKVNRFIKNVCYPTIKSQLNYFGVRINQFASIKKLKWI